MATKVLAQGLSSNTFYLLYAPNGLFYWQVGGRGQCLGAEKTQGEENARKR